MWGRGLLLVGMCAILAACAAQPKKPAPTYTGPVAAPSKPQETVTTTPPWGEAPTPSGKGGIYKVGNPYVINGVTYVPHEDPDYSETGIASWYGPQFHGARTANGEIFDMELVSAAHRKSVMDFVDIARADGARLVSGGVVPAGRDQGWYYRPTVFDEVNAAMRIAREEVFGPLLVVMPFDSDDQALEIANGVEFGLAAGIFTRDLNRAMRFVRDVEAGMAWVNEWFQSPVQVPHGGVKHSGIGREQGMVAFGNYLQSKDIAIRLPS